jgi:hypothetical protein
MTQVIFSAKTSVFIRATRHHIPEEAILPANFLPKKYRSLDVSQTCGHPRAFSGIDSLYFLHLVF